MRIRGSFYARGALALALITFATRAEATVTQVDGTIVPISDMGLACFTATPATCGMINFFKNHGEEPPAVPVGLDPIGDATESPQIFTPDTAPGHVVIFEDIGEGAGFESSFGWYNVGDDVSTPAGRIQNLHIVTGCGKAMVNTPINLADNTKHYGNPAFYIVNAEEEPPGTGPGGPLSVDFNAEKAAGRYKGGFIAFYLITPENSQAKNATPSINCGDFTVETNGNSDFGKIYFTQKDLNNDGDFVHDLVYKSVAKPNAFIFGFEDLFRGGDNDFEDDLFRVAGLTPPCIPQAEVCDGIDNDCDGIIDEDAVGTNVACTCDGVSLTCDNGPKFGQCQVGVTECVAAEIVCHGTGQPTQEICDGLDNNCNGIIDDNPTGTGAACDGTDADLCKNGQIVCQNGSLVCNEMGAGIVEVCNGLDDDCDGKIDEGDPGGGGACGSSLGVCKPGTNHCVGGAIVCQGGVGPGPELCNGLDDNCNGVVDDNPTDVGQTCGTSNVGQCKFGQTICVNGGLQCAGEVGPSPETCNGLDDNCNGIIDDNPVDAGQPCGSSIGACKPGVFVCVNGGLVCQGGVGPTPEVCDGIDNDCDGIIDEDSPGQNLSCGAGNGPCSAGETKCINGAIQCVGGTSGGTEVCNGIDDDCDGIIDEGDLCNGGVCQNGQCAAPCLGGEFPCPNGFKCDTSGGGQGFCVKDPCFGVTCPNDAMGDLQSCTDAGICAPVCNAITCPTGFACRGRDGACVPDNCAFLPLCTTGQICLDQMCQPDPCAGVTCGDGQFCRGGTCEGSCQGVNCAVDQVCTDGACVASGCSQLCPTGEVCDPNQHACVPSMICNPACLPLQVCNPLTGQCVDDPCNGVVCPDMQVCSNGQCGTGVNGQLVTAAGGGGCSTSGGDPSLLVGLGALALILRRKKAILLAAGLTLGSCNFHDYCIDCEIGDGGGIGDGSSAGSSDAGNVGCDPNDIHPETCNGADDDCDGIIDEGFDLQTDAMNCGMCGNQCNKPGAQTACMAGMCVITACFPGHVDLDGDIGNYATSDGCEYACFQSNNGVEACDGLDNDCDGKIDEGIDLTGDINNCGACNHVCEFFEATPHCTGGTCSFNPATDCQPGFTDVDMMQADGCEYECTKTNGGVEKCDAIDNNCNGQVDEGFNFMTDPLNCGRCGLVCQFPHATASCVAGACTFNPATDCQAGFHDVDHNQLNGCEYACNPTNGGVEKCDGIDNNCDGIADNNPVDAGGSCASVSPPKGACIANGILTCSAGHLVCAGATDPTVEICNNIDDNCDGIIDNGVTQICYTGPGGTTGIGACKPGVQTCAAGAFGACVGEVTPTAEICNGLDDDCNGIIDDGPGGAAITQSCYSGPGGTAGVGTCVAGTKTCSFGAFGSCIGEVDPKAEICGDGLDTNCNGKSDAAEGCLATDAEQRLDAPGGALGTAPGAEHSHDVALASGGVPFGSNVYAAWSELVGGVTEVYLRKSADGGKTWGTIVNVTANQTLDAVSPILAVSPGATDTVYAVYQSVVGGLRSINVQKSTDGGTTWGAPSGSLNAAGDAFHQAVAVSGATVVVTWEQLDTTTLNRDVVSRISTTSAASFNAPATINASRAATTRFAGRPQVGITGAGGVVWAWREQRTGATRDIFAAFTTSTTPPTTDIRIDGDTTDKRDSDFPVLLVNGTNAYLVWQDVSTLASGGSDSIFARSTTSGASWNTEQIIDAPVGVPSSFTPAMALDPKTGAANDDLVAIAWQDEREGTQIFTTVSANSGVTFSAPVRASSINGNEVTGVTTVPQIVAAGSGVLAVTYQNQLDNATSHIFMTTSIDSGATWTFTQEQLDGGAGSAITPQITVASVANKPGGLAAWTDFRTAPHVNGDIFAALGHQ